METSFGGSSELLHDSVIPLLGLCPREMKIGVQKKKKKNKNLRTFIAAVFLMVKQRKQYKSPTTDK